MATADAEGMNLGNLKLVYAKHRNSSLAMPIEFGELPSLAAEGEAALKERITAAEAGIAKLVKAGNALHNRFGESYQLFLQCGEWLAKLSNGTRLLAPSTTRG